MGNREWGNHAIACILWYRACVLLVVAYVCVQHVSWYAAKAQLTVDHAGDAGTYRNGTGWDPKRHEQVVLCAVWWMGVFGQLMYDP